MYQVYSSLITYSISSRQAGQTHVVDVRRNAEEKIIMPPRNNTKSKVNGS